MRVANVFHAGDGNLHPLVLYDNDNPGEAEKAEKLAGDIVFTCLEHGGSLTGEHGIGEDKKKYMPKMFTTEDMDVMQLLRCAFDPHQICNPGKIFPTPRLCGERPVRSACTRSRRPAWRRTSRGPGMDTRTENVSLEDLQKHRRRRARPRGDGAGCRRRRQARLRRRAGLDRGD